MEVYKLELTKEELSALRKLLKASFRVPFTAYDTLMQKLEVKRNTCSMCKQELKNP